MTDGAQNLAAGVGVGLLISVLAVTLSNRSADEEAPFSRPDGLPAEAIWQENVYGAPGWLHCEPAESRVTCTGFSRDGVGIVVANYVPRDGKTAPTPPFEDLVAREVASIWINKVAMVPDGSVEFPVDRLKVDFARGTRVSEPRP